MKTFSLALLFAAFLAATASVLADDAGSTVQTAAVILADDAGQTIQSA